MLTLHGKESENPNIMIRQQGFHRKHLQSPSLTSTDHRFVPMQQEQDMLPPEPASYQDFHFDPSTSSSYIPWSPPADSPSFSFSYASPAAPTPPASAATAELFTNRDRDLFSSFLQSFDSNDAFLLDPSAAAAAANGGRSFGYGYAFDEPPAVLKQEEDGDVDSIISSSGSVSGSVSGSSGRSTATPSLLPASAYGVTRPLVPLSAPITAKLEEDEGDENDTKVAAGPVLNVAAEAAAPARARSLRKTTTMAATHFLPHLHPHPHPTPNAAASTSTLKVIRSSSSAAAAITTTTTGGSSAKKQPLTAAQKRANHILSEQTRRSAIKEAFRNLVDLLLAGSEDSGIFVEQNEEDDVDEDADEDDQDEEDDEEEDGKRASSNGSRRKSISFSKAGQSQSSSGSKRKKTTTVKGKVRGKARGRGRGRKAEIGNGVAKSLILEQAVMYIRWLEKGNLELKMATQRVEQELMRSIAMDGRQHQHQHQHRRRR